MPTRRQFLAALAAPAAAPQPFGALPSRRQLLWHQLEFYAFLHFTTNTFTDKEWGYGDEDPSLFNPTAFDPDAIVSALRAAGMTAVILTCKHHDGFCLWPTRTTQHSLRASTWRNGQGDVVKDLSTAARKQGLKFGVYLSPWDRNHPAYATPAYIPVYREQLRELLTNYGEIFEVWHDGANGGDGYYGGAREKRAIDRTTYYDWPGTWEIVRRLQPDACIFSDVGPDIRWIGNENGIAAETSWATYQPVGEKGDAPAPGYTRYREGASGHRNAGLWLPGECDVSIRRGWFYHQNQDAGVKTPRQLLDLYYKSVGRGSNFLLNVPPDRRGLIHETDASHLRQLGQALRATFGANLAAKARLTASHTRGRAWEAKNLLDGRRDTYWTAPDDVSTPELVLELPRPVTFNLIRLREHLPLGQRIDAVAIDQWSSGAWAPLAAATSIGNCRLIRTAQDITAARLRLRVTQAAACPALSEFGLYYENGL